MPLIVASLESELNDVYSDPNGLTGANANKYANAIINFFDSAIAPGGASVNTKAGTGLILNACNSSWAQSNPTSSIPANNIAIAINTALSSAIILGGIYGTGPLVVTGIGGLISELTDAYSQINNSPSILAKAEAQAISNLVSSATAFGTGVGAPPVPQIGGLN